tara:strand:- start:1036 stop:2919 length:1884 start_codon:yes stop_codon:yes gene_type:complete
LIFNFIGNYSLILSLLTSILVIGIIFIKEINIQENKSLKLNSLIFFQFFFQLISFVSLIVLFIISEFSNLTVYSNSHTTKPLFYKISGTWGNHEGSLLLWLLILTFSIFLYTISSTSRPLRERILTILFQQIIIVGFTSFTIFTSNPFSLIFPLPKEGLGLNPILQDPILAIHPPVLYLGYVSTSIIFSSSLASLISGNVDRIWAKHIKQWTFFSWIFLTGGILLGSIWAYYELGWGGFWFWDPVENISLMPWLSLTALIHCILVLERRSTLKSWTIILSISTFTLSVCGTFLVRSGILNSVHTFANDPQRGLYILIFLFFLIFAAIFIYFMNEEKLKNDFVNFGVFSKESSILINNWFMMYFLAVILIGTVYPIFLEVISNQKISVGPPFFNKLIIPFLIPFLFFMSIGPNLSWLKSSKMKNKIYSVLFLIINLCLGYVILGLFGSSNLTLTILLGASFYLFFISIKDITKKKVINVSQKISHFGFSLLILSIIMNAILSKEIITNIKVGQEISFNNNNIKFEKLEINEINNYKQLVSYFSISDKKNSILFKPEIRIYNQPNIMTSEADIKTNLIKDRFMVVNLIKDDYEYFNLRYQEKPFMIWIWLSTLLIILGGSINLLNKNEK